MHMSNCKNQSCIMNLTLSKGIPACKYSDFIGGRGLTNFDKRQVQNDRKKFGMKF